MPISIEHNVIWFEVAEYDLVFMQVLNREDDLTQVIPGNFLREPSTSAQCEAHVSTRGILDDEIEPVRRLKSVVHPHDERVFDKGKDIPLSQRVFLQVLKLHLLFLEYFHGEKLLLFLLFHQVD